MTHWLPNAIAFQLAWFAAVAGAAHGWWWAGPAALAAFAAAQVVGGGQAGADLRLMLACALLGAAIDTLWVRLDLMRFATPVPAAGFAPVWIVAMWMSFALTLNHSLAVLQKHLVLAAGLGIVGAPLAYLAAARVWGAVELAQPTWVPLAALAAAWGIVTPALLYWTRRIARPPQRAGRDT